MKRNSTRPSADTTAQLTKRRRFAAWLAPNTKRPKRQKVAEVREQLEPPPRVVPGDLARMVLDLPDEMEPDNLVKAASYKDGFKVSLGALSDLIKDEAAGTEKFTLRYGPGNAFELTVNVVVDEDTGVPSPDPVIFDVPAAFLGPNSEYAPTTMSYRLIYNGGSSDDGPTVNLAIDGLGPAPGGAFIGHLIFSEEILKNGITLDSFAGVDYIEATIPGYNGEKPADWIRPYINGVLDLDTTHYAVVPWDDKGNALKLRYYRDFIEAADDGTWDFQCDVDPREENPSGLSKAVRIVVSIKEGIGDLNEPLVPAYDDDPVGARLITEQDARDALIVVIPSHKDITEADTVEIRWGDEVLVGPVAIVDPSDIRVVVPYDAILSVWLDGNEAGADIARDLDVSYVIYGETGNRRGISPLHPVTVNLHVAGGIVDPDPGTEPNENLSPLTLFSASEEENRIPLDDKTKAARAEIPKLSLAEDTDGENLPAFAVNDIITVRDPDDKVLATKLVDAADLVTPDDFVPIAINAATVEALPGGVLDISYWIATKLASGETNVNKSPAQPVTVETADKLPGKGVLPEVQLPEQRSGDDWIVLADILNGVAVGLPAKIDNFEPLTDDITVSIPMYQGTHKAGEAVVPGYGDVDGQNRFVIRAPHVVRAAETGEVDEPSGEDGAARKRPPITVEHILFRLELDKFPTIDEGLFYHSHVRWTITNSVGSGSSPPPGLKVSFETRGTPESKKPLP